MASLQRPCEYNNAQRLHIARGPRQASQLLRPGIARVQRDVVGVLEVWVHAVRDLGEGRVDIEPGEVRGACCAGLDPERSASMAEGDVTAVEEAADGRRGVRTRGGKGTEWQLELEVRRCLYQALPGRGWPCRKRLQGHRKQGSA